VGEGVFGGDADTSKALGFRGVRGAIKSESKSFNILRSDRELLLFLDETLDVWVAAGGEAAMVPREVSRCELLGLSGSSCGKVPNIVGRSREPGLLAGEN
jgi:hypothetical protein